MPPKQILLIEHDKKLVQSTAELLQSHHYKLDIAYTGADALQRLNHVPDLVLIDYLLPDIKGVEICRKMRGNERWHDVPIIVLTDDHISPEEIEDLYVYGDDHITKPCDREELLARVEIVLRYRQLALGIPEEERDIIRELDRILQKELITSFFQPIYSAPSLQIFGIEALSRPETDTSLSNPELFFKAALGFGVYTDIEKLAWRKAFSQWKKLFGQGKLFLNGTPYFIGNNPMNEEFFKSLDVDPRHVVIELTERTAIRNHEIFMHKLKALRGLGMQIAVDDVGSGFASLNTVAEVRPDYVKIDLRLIRHINSDELRKNIVQSIITFCHQSGIRTIAEGIEYREELQTVCALGVDAVQGYFLGKPSPEISKKMFSKNLDL